MYEVMDATVIIKSSSDQQSYKGEIANDRVEVGDFLPDLETIIHSARYFRDAGFHVLPKHNCIKLSGSASQFESMFGICIPVAEMAKIGNVKIPELLDGVLVRVIFQHDWAQAS